ncbi:hypothetical protein DIPPA_11457 [Diplonema papillatum]|nr:hypothetical protein DIPPA_11457 [Diplonema papillatum]
MSEVSGTASAGKKGSNGGTAVAEKEKGTKNLCVAADDVEAAGASGATTSKEDGDKTDESSPAESSEKADDLIAEFQKMSQDEQQRAPEKLPHAEKAAAKARKERSDSSSAVSVSPRKSTSDLSRASEVTEDDFDMDAPNTEENPKWLLAYKYRAELDPADNPDINTTEDEPEIELTESGPATYKGGAPLPGSPRNDVDPDTDYNQRKHDYAKDAHDKKREAKRGLKARREQKQGSLLERFRSRLDVANSRLNAKVTDAQHAITDKLRSVMDHREQQFLESCFPEAKENQEIIREAFMCRYLDGAGSSYAGFLLITDSNIRFTLGKKKMKMTITFSSIASIDGSETAMIKIFTTDKEVYQFIDIQGQRPGTSIVPAHTLAHDWIDHLWRKNCEVPNPAATYYAS